MQPRRHDGAIARQYAGDKVLRIDVSRRWALVALLAVENESVAAIIAHHHSGMESGVLTLTWCFDTIVDAPYAIWCAIPDAQIVAQMD